MQRVEVQTGMMDRLDEQVTPTSAYDLLTEAERKAVDEYVGFAVGEQRKRHQPVAGALNMPIPSEYIRRSRQALYRPIVRAAIAERITEEAPLCLLVTSPRSALISDPLSVFAFHAFDHLEEYCPGILYNVPLSGFVWYFFSWLDWSYGFGGGRPQK